MKKVVVLTGAGMSAESGISTFRGSDGLWEGHDVKQVASPAGWKNDEALVLDFYNKRRAQLKEVSPNAAHVALASLQSSYDVTVITQNVDDLHERAGQTDVLHLHGELRKVRSTFDDKLVYDWQDDLNQGDKCELGFQLRPHIVWFGEAVPSMELAVSIVSKAQICIIIGTSMQVYPAASLVHFVPSHCPIYFVDPKPNTDGLTTMKNLIVIKENASTGVVELVEKLINENK